MIPELVAAKLRALANDPRFDRPQTSWSERNEAFERALGMLQGERVRRLGWLQLRKAGLSVIVPWSPKQWLTGG